MFKLAKYLWSVACDDTDNAGLKAYPRKSKGCCHCSTCLAHDALLAQHPLRIS